MATLRLAAAKLGPDRDGTSDAVVGDRLWKERTASGGLIVSFTFSISPPHVSNQNEVCET